jgi:pSer/pThr/pTyr-binding forkhead associated (FHA) protein
MSDRDDQVSFTRIVGPPDAAAGEPLPAPAERPALWWRPRLGEEQAYSLDRERMTIGRLDDNDIVLAGPTVSAHHAVLRVEGARVLLEDEGSLNGTFRNGERVEQAQLEAGDRIQIGPHLLVFVPARG